MMTDLYQRRTIASELERKGISFFQPSCSSPDSNSSMEEEGNEKMLLRNGRGLIALLTSTPLRRQLQLKSTAQHNRGVYVTALIVCGLSCYRETHGLLLVNLQVD